MVEASWFVFIVSSLVLIATPGQDMISRDVTITLCKDRRRALPPQPV